MSTVYLDKFRNKMSELRSEKTAPVPDWRYQSMLRQTLKEYLEEPPSGLSEGELAEARALVR